MIMICDIQILTGIGILVSAFCTLGGPHGVSAYHWLMAVYLSWLSNITHATGLTFLRQYLSANPSQRTFRFIFMAILFLLLIVALIPTGFFEWNSHEYRQSPYAFARCFFATRVPLVPGVPRPPAGLPEGSGTTMILTICLLTYTFMTRIVKVSDIWSAHIRRLLRHPLSGAATRLVTYLDSKIGQHVESQKLHRLLSDIFIIPLIAIHVTVRIHTDFYTSYLSEVRLHVHLKSIFPVTL